MHQFRLMVMVSVLDAALAAGCTDDVEEMSQTAQAIDGPCDGGNDFDCRCAGCSANGMTQGQWDAMFNQADSNALDDFGAWIPDGPVRLCATPPSNTATSCVLHSAWHDWLHSATPNGKLVGILTEVVRVCARKGFIVHDPGGNNYYGAFGLAHEALSETPMSYRTQELMTGGLLALIDGIHGVPVCLKSEHTPNNCAGMGEGWFESTTFGKTFRMHYAAIEGGDDAAIPALNLRFSTMKPTSAKAFTNGQACQTQGSDENAIATHCVDQFGRPWDWPVTVITPFFPHAWYYDTGPVPNQRPADVPQTM